MRFLRTNTAIRITVGPFLDKTDGITPETGLTATNEHLTLMVDDSNVPTLVLDANATASGGNNDLVHVTGDDAGFYDLELTAANLNYLGRAMLSINYATDHCPVFHEFMIVPAMIYDSVILGTDRLDTNVTHIADTSQTARDIGASVLLSSGTGTGQIDFTSGVVKSNLAQILGTALTETAGQIAAAFKQFFNIPTPTSTMNVITSVTTTATATNLTNAPTNGDLTATMKASVNTEVDTAIADVGLTTTITGRIDAAISTRLASASYTAPLDAAGTRSAVGLASANLDTQLDTLPTAAEIATAVWSAVTRTLTSISDSSGVTTLLSRIASTLNITSGKVESNIKQINDTTITGDGSGTPWGPA